MTAGTGADSGVRAEKRERREIPALQDCCTTGVAVSSKGLVRIASEKR